MANVRSVRQRCGTCEAAGKPSLTHIARAPLISERRAAFARAKRVTAARHSSTAATLDRCAK
jgi:hypothetical protein